MVDLLVLAEQVRRDIETYEIPPRRPDALGAPLPPEWFAAGLKEIRELLVEPYWADPMSDSEDDAVRVVIVAEDPGHAVLAFDPMHDEYILGAIRDGRFGSWNVRGDVGCFLSR
jgi:hypothetical protein